MAKLEALARQYRAVLRLSVHESASKVNRSGGDAQIVSRHRYLVVFHPFVEQLIASYPGSSPAEKRGESLEDLITCPVTYYAWFYAWF